nr:putative ribonuclease H-like domain-containing protein [Tanacetum cinerariifolium]
NKIEMHTSRDDYLINTLTFVSAKEETQIYGAILPECLTSPEMKETQAYMTYLVSTKAPTGKSKRVKRPAKKSTETPARGVVIKETPKMPLTKKKERVDVTPDIPHLDAKIVSPMDVHVQHEVLLEIKCSKEIWLGFIMYRTPWTIKGVLRIQQRLQHEHYAQWEVIEFGDSYKAPPEETTKDKGLAALPDEHQLRFNKYDTTKELWEAKLMTFGGNEATKKTKKNQLKQQYGNFKAEGSETLKQTFNRLQAIRNRDDLNTMSLDDVYNHLKVYKPEVQKRAGSNSQNMAFISSSNTISRKSKVHTVQGVSTASAQVSTDSTDVATSNLSYDNVCAFIDTQRNGSQIKYKDISQIDDDDIEEMDIKWNLALLSMRADRFWKKTGKKITIQGSNVAGFDKLRREREREKECYKKDPKVEEPAPKAMIAIDGIRWDWSYMAEEDEALKNHALVVDEEEVPTEYALIAKSRLLESQKLDKDKKVVGFNEYYDVLPPPVQVYLPPKKDLYWMGLPRLKIPTVGSKVLAAKPAIAADKGNKGKAVKGIPQDNIDDKGYGTMVALDKSMLWHRRLGHLNFKSMNKLVRSNLVKGLPSKSFENDHSCIAYLKGKQHKASCKFDAKGDKGYYVGYFLSSKAFRVFNKRTKKIEENLRVDFLENKSIEKGTGPDWLFDIDTLTNSMNYVPVVVAGTSSTNISGTKKDVHQAVKEKESPLRFISLLNWFHEAQMATSNEAAKKDKAIPDNNASTKVSTNESFKLASSLTVVTKVPTISTLVLTGGLSVPLVTLSVPRIISSGGSSYPKPLSLGNAMSFENKLEDFFGDTSDEEGIDYEEVFAPVARIEAIRLCLPYASHQVTPKECHLHAVNRIFKYLKGHPKLGLWYPKESPFDLVAYLNSDYGGANQDRKSTTKGCQFLGRRLISWQCNKQTIVATSTTKAEYVAATSGCGQMLWIQNQLLDYGVETMDGETKILAKVNRRQRTVSKSSIMRHLKLNDEEGISTLLDNELFENLSLMGYNILPNQSTSFNEFSSNIATALVCLATNRTYNFSKMIFDGMMRNVKSKGKFLSGSKSNKKPKLECWKCGKTGHFKRDYRSGKKNNANAGGSGKGSKDQDQVDAIAWWIDSGATTHVCKDRCWFKTFDLVGDGSVLYMGDEHFTPVHGK